MTIPQKYIDDGSIRLKQVETTLTQATVGLSSLMRFIDDASKDKAIVAALADLPRGSFDAARNDLRDVIGALRVADKALRSLHSVIDGHGRALGITPASGKGK
jgi:hypothetical protein